MYSNKEAVEKIRSYYEDAKRICDAIEKAVKEYKKARRKKDRQIEYLAMAKKEWSRQYEVMISCKTALIILGEDKNL